MRVRHDEWYKLSTDFGEWRDARPAVLGVLLHDFILGKLYFAVYDGKASNRLVSRNVLVTLRPPEELTLSA